VIKKDIEVLNLPLSNKILEVSGQMSLEFAASTASFLADTAPGEARQVGADITSNKEEPK